MKSAEITCPRCSVSVKVDDNLTEEGMDPAVGIMAGICDHCDAYIEVDEREIALELAGSLIIKCQRE